jgi:DNA-binding MarR family transcriptional regulator
VDKTEKKRMEAYIYGGIFALSNKLQLIGDKLDSNISTKQWFLIAIIVSFQDEAPTISMTAERMGTSRQNIKKMASILEQRGFLVIVRDKEDGRIQRLELTEYCIDYFDQRREREEKYMESLFVDFDKEMLFVFFRGMKQFERNINRMEKENEEKG